MITVLEVLEQARARIAKGWTQGWFVRDENDKRLNIEDPNGCKYCLSGALFNHEAFHSTMMDARYFVTLALPGTYNIVGFNDRKDTTQQDVLNVLDKAMELAKVDK